MHRELVRRNVIILTVSMIVFFLLSLYITTLVNRNNSQKQLLYLSKIVSNDIMTQTNSEEEVKTLVNAITKEQSWLSVCVATNLGYIIVDSGYDAMGEGQYIRLEQYELDKLNAPDASDRVYISNGRMYYVESLTESMVLRTSLQVDDNTNFILQSVFFLLVLLIVVLAVSIVLTGKTSRSVSEAFNNVTEHLRTISDGSYRDIDTKHKYEEVSEAYKQINAINESLIQYIRRISEERDKVNFIINNISEGIVILETSGRIYSVNDFARRIFGTDLAEGSVFTEEVKDRPLAEMISQEIATGKELHFDYHEKTSDRYFLVNLNCFRHSEGKGKLISIVLYDVTSARREERSKADFIANASHELKTPITSISGFSELLMSGLVTKEKDRKQYIDNIYREAVSMRHMIEELLYLSRLDSDRKVMATEEVDLSALAKSVTENYKNIAGTKKVTLKCKGKGVSVTGNRSLLEHLLMNLVDNGIKYNKEKGSVTVETAADEEGNPFIRVSDSGLGIAPQDLNRLFERFYRADSSRNRETGGTGLGLTIVQRICMLHGAEINVDSTHGKGSTFIVTFKKGEQK